ncbi:endonuclease MutS2 [Paenibacillus thalictri]|uniref:DNA mismatch repair protein MutS n=1 Tax=Paenibacillus thalictri TaxID=2527873 RepID=A0A4Q9DM34_9BACL|nr:DNA mismatch repair protein MutS [Paenibacillus thalictri]TBL74015.1 DNA mismatch repair protein MutS [Paenibacillus thalictri]
MDDQSKQRLEFTKVKQQLYTYAMSYLGQRRAEQLEPIFDAGAIRSLLRETEETKAMIRSGSSIPVPSLEGMEQVMALLGTGYMYSERELGLFARLLESVGQLRRFMQRKEAVAPTVTTYALSMYELGNVREELDRCLRNGQITDQASKDLAKIRKQSYVLEERIKKKLDALMQKYRPYLQEYIVGSRNGRHVLAVKKEHRRLVSGQVLDESASGQTVFVEPADIAGFHWELSELKRDEAREEAKVLSALTALVETYEHELKVNLEAIGHYDFLFAKAKYALELGANPVEVNTDGIVRIRGGKHPLLGRNCVPLDFEIGEWFRALMVTGPNTGGKTVSLKTVGLLVMMVQSGLQVPVAEGSTFPVFRNVLADIGDGQSIEQSLSTFSSHIRNVIGILRQAGPDTLVLLDELATGTDPGEGVALSIAVLEELYAKGAVIVATTHFNEIKRYAAAATGFENARMEFDAETLSPLYKLTIGEAGNSYAFYIAEKLGMPLRLVERSRQIAVTMAVAGDGTDRVSGESITMESGETGTVAQEEEPKVEETITPEPRNMGSSAQGKVDAKTGGTTLAREALVEHATRPGGSYPSNAAPDALHPAKIGKRFTESKKTNRSDNKTQSVFEIGDCVWIHSLKRTGIVCALPDERGNVTVMIQKEKVKINAKRLSLHIERKQLYPGEDYDMDIVFDSKENRKKKRLMQRKHAEGVMIVRPSEEEK